MKKLLLTSLFLCSLNSIFAQYPGGIGTTNLTAWFLPDSLTLGGLNSWSTTYPAGGSAITLTESGGALPMATNTPANATSNYNSTVDFSGNASGASMKALENPANLNLLDNNSSGNTSTFFCVYYLPVAQSGAGHMVMYRESSVASTDGIQLRTSLGGSVGRIAIGSSTNSSNASRDWTEEFKPTIVTYTGNRSGAATMTATKRSRTFTGGVNSGTTGNPGLRFGVQYTTTPSYTGFYEGFISEVIFYSRNLNATELLKVNSYLAVKYGITLDNTGGGTQGDYIGTNSSNIWDADLSPSYHNDVIGIGRDDSEKLMQKQSHTFDDVTRIYLNTLQTTNVTNSGTFASDISYLLTGSNNGLVCSTTGSILEMPAGCGLYSRLEREWKVTKTNFSIDYSMDIKLSNCASPGSVNVSELRFLVDDDGDFSNGGTTCYYNGDGSGINISYSAPVISVSGITAAMIPNNTTRYVTIGSIQSTTPLPIELLTFDAQPEFNRQVALTWSTASEHNNDYFTIEKSREGNEWFFVADVNGAGNSTTTIDYSHYDFNPFLGISYYRLKQTDFDGNVSNSDLRMVEINVGDTELSVFPNPVQDVLYFTVRETDEIERIYIQDFAGRIVKQNIDINANHIDVSMLSVGSYFLMIDLKNGDKQRTRFTVY